MDLIERQAAIDAVHEDFDGCLVWDESGQRTADEVESIINQLPSALPEGYLKIPETGIDDVSDGFHTFRQLYYQRMMLFATIVKQNKDKAWKSWKHEDGEPCFGGGWFIVGIDTPEGSYTYHYEDNYFNLFDCEELERSKHWDGHTEKDVKRLLSLSPAQPEMSDLINRQKALDALWKALYDYEDKTEKQFQESDELDVGDWINHRVFVQNMNDIDRQTILDLPAVQHERNRGKWNKLSEDTFHCLECGKTFMVMQGKYNMNFCPACGAEMRTIVEGEG